MNYLADFRRQADEFAYIVIAEQIENQLQNSDIFLTLSENARTYWMGSDAIVIDEPEKLETSYIHYRFELLKNKVDRLDRYLNVICRKGLNTDDDLLSLITDCIIHMAPKSITAILNYKKQDFDFYRHAYQRLEDNLHRVQTPSDQANLSKPFQLFRIQNFKDLNFNDELLQACTFNHPEAIEYLLKLKEHESLDYDFLESLISLLLTTKAQHESNWDTMIDSIKLISEQIFLLNNPEKSRSILKRLNAEGLNTNTPQGKKLHDLAIKYSISLPPNDSVNAESSTENSSCLYLLMMYIWNFIKAVFVFLHIVQPDEQRHPISNNR